MAHDHGSFNESEVNVPRKGAAARPKVIIF